MKITKQIKNNCMLLVICVEVIFSCLGTREGREVARAVDEDLMGYSNL